MNHRHTTQSGFTLVELMVVIAIISILAAFTAPSFERHIAKAKLVNVQLLSNSITNEIDEFVMVHSHYPDNSEFSNLLPDYSHIGEIDSISNNKVDTFQGEFTIVLNDSIGITSGQYLKQSKQSVGQWLCTTTLDPQVTPAECSATQAGGQP